MMWRFYIVPSREERIERGITTFSIQADFEAVKEEYPDIRMLFTDSKDKNKSEWQGYV